MEIVYRIQDVRRILERERRTDQRIGLVPTMGALHAGHGSLIEAAVNECDFVVVTIFVNPTQFSPGEDLDQYPRTLKSDVSFCENLGADLIFAPSDKEMYPSEHLTWVDVDKLTTGLCGAKRPGHFKGVTTVCTMLFNIVQADVAYFGQKDAQQALVIRRMVKDLNIPLEIRICPIIREEDGLAMSSRNQYLSEDERKRAVCLYQALMLCKERIQSGQRNAKQLIAEMEAVISRNQGEIEYVRIVDTKTLEPLAEIEQEALIALAVKIGQTRLIDNLLIDLKM